MPQDFRIAWTSPQICKMAYSPALWYIFTQEPAPPLPFIVAQGRPSSALAEAASITSLMSFQTLKVPPGKKAGPFLAPSSPPLIPMPRKRRPFASSSSARRVWSRKCAFPVSTMISFASKTPQSCLMVASVGPPAFTRMSARRGFLSAFLKSSMVLQPWRLVLSLCASMNFSMVSVVRLNTATWKPLSAMFSARLLPITARPMTPTSHVMAAKKALLEEWRGWALTGRCRSRALGPEPGWSQKA
mmetsp:Transcript_2881/g.8669  ORF Transcript_2881/g.8669 Transcript_2881/m.8669 type:complete len:244 (-) Transcript_2881:37-768(-)